MLKDVVMDWAKEYYGADDVQTALENVTQHGCQSGMVCELIYYVDTVKFYNEHQQEIDTMLAELVSDTGMQPAELFGDKWDSEDPLARDTFNQNLLAWFGFEETARQLLDEME